MKRIIVPIGIVLLGIAAASFAEPIDTISTGTVYAYGHELKPPYILEIVDGTLRVNGVQVYPDLAQYARETPPPEEEISEWTKRTGPIYRKTWDMEARLKKEGKPAAEVTAEIAEFVRQQEDLVDSVTDVHSMGFMVHWKDGSEEVFITYDRRKDKQTKEEQLQNRLEAWRLRLTMRNVIVVGDGTLSCPQKRSAEVYSEIERARTATPEELEEWRSVFFGKGTARMFRHPWPMEEIR